MADHCDVSLYNQCCFNHSKLQKQRVYVKSEEFRKTSFRLIMTSHQLPRQNKNPTRTHVCMLRTVKNVALWTIIAIRNVVSTLTEILFKS